MDTEPTSAAQERIEVIEASLLQEAERVMERIGIIEDAPAEVLDADFLLRSAAGETLRAIGRYRAMYRRLAKTAPAHERVALDAKQRHPKAYDQLLAHGLTHEEAIDAIEQTERGVVAWNLHADATSPQEPAVPTPAPSGQDALREVVKRGQEAEKRGEGVTVPLSHIAALAQREAWRLTNAEMDAIEAKVATSGMYSTDGLLRDTADAATDKAVRLCGERVAKLEARVKELELALLRKDVMDA